METVVVILSVKPDQVDTFESGFREHELPIWHDYEAEGVMTRASLTKLDISSARRGDAVQYLIVVDFADEGGHDRHDSDPRFEAWNRLADAYQIGDGMAFGGTTILKVGGGPDF
jgi:hypothetical protein